MPRACVIVGDGAVTGPGPDGREFASKLTSIRPLQTTQQQRRRAGKPDLRAKRLRRCLSEGPNRVDFAKAKFGFPIRPTQDAILARSPHRNSQRQRLGQACRLQTAKPPAVRQAHGPEQRRGATGPSITTNDTTPSAYNLHCPRICITTVESLTHASGVGAHALTNNAGLDMMPRILQACQPLLDRSFCG